MQAARIIPVSGISNEKEAEQRAASAFLAVLTIVRDLSVELLAPRGASRAARAVVEAYTEPVYTLGSRRIRPDGLVRVVFGKTEWSCFVEVKTGDATLEAEQLNDYWDLARQEKVNHVLTISNEIAPATGGHPTVGLRVRANSPVQVTHLSWTAILTAAVQLKQHRGVTDPEQAWILGELIRYLEHPASGALAFNDMGNHWVAVRDAARTGSLSRKDAGVDDVVARWDQLVRYAALKLSSDIGVDVEHALPRAHRDPKTRAGYLTDELVGHGRLDGTLRIPNTAGNVDLVADLHGQQVIAAVEVAAPDDRGAKGRVSWLVGQLKDAPGDLVVEAYPHGARGCTSATLAQARDDRQAVLGDEKREPVRFRLVMRTPMGGARKAGGKTAGFIDSVLGIVDRFYATVVQTITPWTPPAPKMQRPPQTTSADTDGGPSVPTDDEGPAETRDEVDGHPPVEIERTTGSDGRVRRGVNGGT